MRDYKIAPDRSGIVHTCHEIRGNVILKWGETCDFCGKTAPKKPTLTRKELARRKTIALERAYYEGITRGPGKFEGCTPYEAYAWLNDPEPYDDPEVEEQNWREYCQFNGWDPDNLPDWVDEDEERALYDEGQCLNFRWVPGRTEFMGISDWHIFPELYNVEYIDLWEDDNGFVYAQCKTYRDNFTVSPLVGLEVRLDLTEDTSYRMTRITLVREDGTRNWYRLRNTQQVEALIARIKGLHLKEACWNWQSVTVVYSK